VSKGDFVWYGNASDYKRIWHMATQENRTTRKRVLLKAIAGREADTGNFLVGNGGVDKNGNVHLKDEEGIIDINGTFYRLLAKDKSSRGGMPIFNFKYDGNEAKKRFLEVFANTQKLWGPQVELLWGWGIAHLFRNRWWTEYKSFPLCIIPGPPGIGKNTIMSFFLALYGLPFEPTVVKGMTPTGLFNRVNAYCDIPVWVDEWKNDVNSTLAEMFKSNADGSVKHVGTLDEFTTKTRRHRTGCFITGEFRAVDTALNQRCVMVNLRKQEDSTLVDETRAMTPYLSAFLVRLLQDYESHWQALLSIYKATRTRWEKALAGEVDIRIVENYAKVCAALVHILPDDDEREARFLRYMKAKVTESGDMNPAVEALKFMPRYITGSVGRKGWVRFYVDLKKKKFNLQPEDLIRVYCDFTKQPVMGTDDLFRYAQEAGIIHPSQQSATMKFVSLKMSIGGKTLSRRGWPLNWDNELVREVAEELSPFCDKQAMANEPEGSPDQAPNL